MSTASDPGAVRGDYRPDPNATPGPPRDLTRGRAKAGTCPTIPFFAPAGTSPYDPPRGARP